METSLHRQLKAHYAPNEEAIEVQHEGFRIDAVLDSGELVEIQHASLGALRDKTRKLLSQTKNRLRIIKPVLARKRVTTLTDRDGEVKRSRMSPKRGTVVDIFEDLVHFSTVFPRARLTLEIALIEAEEVRLDRKRPTRRGVRHRTIDQRLVEVIDSVELRTKNDLLELLPYTALPTEFDTAELGAAMDRPRWFAQKVAYCLRHTGVAKLVGKRGNSQLYRLTKKRRKKSAA